MNGRRKIVRRLGTWLLLLSLSPFWAVPSRAEEPVTLTCLINHTWYPVSSFTGIIPEEITRLTGVRLDVAIARDPRQLNLLLASGNLPDLIYTSTQFELLSNAAFCYDYDTLIERYGVQWEIGDDLRANALVYSKDGRPYTVINHYTRTEDWADTSAVPMTASMLIRQDILSAMGNPPIRTTGDLMGVYLRVKEEYPGLIPLTFNGTHRFNAFRVWFGLGLADFVEQADQSYLFYSRDARYYQMLAYLNKLYQKGCLLVDNFATTTEATGLLYKRGKAFSYSACTQNANVYMDTALNALNPGFHSVELYPLEDSNQSVSNLGWSGVFITKNCKDPEAAIKLMAWMFTPEAQKLTQWGREGTDYTLDKNNLPVYSPGLLQTIVQDTYNTVYNPWFYFGASAIVESEGRCALMDISDYQNTYTAIREGYRNLPWITAATPQEGTREKEIYDRINAGALTYETKIILSDTDAVFEANFAEYMNWLEALGVKQLEDFMSLKIPGVMQNYLTK